MAAAAKAQDSPEKCSLASFDENNPNVTINSPRSLTACKSEGVLPQELIYKPVEAFQEKNLSPRLVKLRYDFFEAKRRDLLAASRKARDGILAEEKREKDSQIDTLAQQSGLTRGAILALNSDNLKLERQKLLRAQERERNWLKNALNMELSQLKTLEHHNQRLSEEAQGEEEKQRQAAIRLKELSDRRALEEEKKTMENDARQKLEKQLAKEEWLKQQEELKKKGELEARRQKEVYQRQMEEMERKREAEAEKAKKKEDAHKEMVAKKEEMRAQDLKRLDILEQQRQQFQVAMRDKKEVRDVRIYQSIENNQEFERKRRADFEEKCRVEQVREERLAQKRAIEQEESAKNSFRLLMRRKLIQEDAARKQEERRDCIVEQQEETEMRLLEHEQKKERYLDFKRELDGLRARNKEINVERQRRKEEAAREMVAEQVKKKDEKMEWMQTERKRLHQIRRATQTEAYRARELVKNEIMKQRVASKFNSRELGRHVNNLVQNDLFTPKILQTSTSMPLLKSLSESQQSHAA